MTNKYTFSSLKLTLSTVYRSAEGLGGKKPIVPFPILLPSLRNPLSGYYIQCCKYVLLYEIALSSYL